MGYYQLIFCFLLGFVSLSYGQNDRGVGSWQTFLSYDEGRTLAETPDYYYAATNHGLYAFNTDDNNLETLTPQQGFSGVNITAMRYHDPSNQLFIAYESGLIDVLINGNQIRTLTEIADKNVVGNKRINEITFIQGNTYFLTTFGIVTYNIANRSFGSTYFGPLSPKWNSTGITKLRDTLYAATQEGLFKAPAKGVNLQDVSTWQKERPEQLGNIRSFNGRLYFQNDTQLLVSNDQGWRELSYEVTGRVDFNIDNDQLFVARPGNQVLAVQKSGDIKVLEANAANRFFQDESGGAWFGNKIFPLLKRRSNGELRFFLPEGPASRSAWSVTARDETLYATGGAITDNFSASFNPSGFYVKNPDGRWQNYNSRETDSIADLFIRDFVDIAVSPKKDRFYAASFQNGLVEIRNQSFYRHYTPANSGLSYASIDDSRFLRVAGVEFDNKGNLWMTNNAADEPLVCFTSDSNWYSYPLNGKNAVLDLEIDNRGRKWIRTQGSGLLVYDNNGTIADKSDDQFRQLTNQEGNGGLPSNEVLSLAIDRDNNIWVGTSDGVGVIFNSSRIFDQAVNAQDVFVEEGENSGILLSGEQVTSIAVDGGNNKWFGTSNGLWYTSPSGDAVLNRFKTANSPLLANEIRDIATEGQAGWVYFATANGLVSYRGPATEGKPKHQDVYAYPNPVRPGYEGRISVKGLVTDALIKITDASGNLVRSLQANGGQVTWDGKNRSGNRVNSGVYYVYSTDEQGEQTKVTKILVMK